MLSTLFSAAAGVVLFGTVLPILGSVATVVLALTVPGLGRWVVLFVLPAVVLVVAWWLAPVVMKNGNLAAAAIFAIYYVGLCVYYPVLLVVGVVVALRSRPGAVDGPRSR